ncbi:glycosyltransferase family 4 protein [Selenomonas ruminantium]|uniref:Glycosyltransferase involved in cell wall bisynthesis n=1 Tax=Selenomonas ruminantium TaxID=971 RepID=A0A1H0PJH5_SELRU|nr:glycosyltransferase family 4 protein [Selenomonas ruminantium]SDP05272.1 Glycosyltransferase involved in cell wall bisynthesis [Selenomonas ruminantium]
MNIGLFIKDFAVGKKFSKDGRPTKSGAEFHGENHALQLIKRGHKVTIMAKKRYWFTQARETIKGIDLVRLHAPFRWLEIIIRLLTTHRHLDAFYIIGTPKFAVWVILYAKLMKKPVTLALTAKAEIFRTEDSWRNKILASCNNYVATTHEIRDGYIAQAHVPAEKVTVLAHGVDMKKYTPLLPERRNELRLENNLAADTDVLLFCARIVENKGIATLLQVWPIVHAKRPKAKLFVVGGGQTELITQLKQMAEETDRSVVVTGEVEAPQVYYQMADIYIFPSWHEALPTSLIEAMASGLVPVTSDIGGCDDLAFDGQTGYRVPVKDAQAYAEKIIYLFDHPEERQQLRANAMALVRRLCDYDYVIDKLYEIIANPDIEGKDYLRP